MTIDNRVEYNSALSCRVDSLVVSKLDWDAFWDIVANPVTMGCHVGHCTSVCIPVNTCIKLQWVQKVRRVKRVKTGMAGSVRDRWVTLRDGKDTLRHGNECRGSKKWVYGWWALDR